MYTGWVDRSGGALHAVAQFCVIGFCADSVAGEIKDGALKAKPCLFDWQKYGRHVESPKVSASQMLQVSHHIDQRKRKELGSGFEVAQFQCQHDSDRGTSVLNDGEFGRTHIEVVVAFLLAELRQAVELLNLRI